MLNTQQQLLTHDDARLVMSSLASEYVLLSSLCLCVALGALHGTVARHGGGDLVLLGKLGGWRATNASVSVLRLKPNF